MSLNIGAVCPAILTSLTDNSINNPETVNIFGGTALALNLPSNRERGRVIRSANENGTGQSREVRVYWKERALVSDTVDTKDCDPGPETPFTEESFTVTQYRGTKFSMSESSMRRLCQSWTDLVRITGTNNPAQVAQRASQIGAASGPMAVVREMFLNMRLQTEALVQAINQDLLDSISVAFGNWLDSVASKSYEIQNADGSVNADGLFKMKQDYMNTGFNGAPIIIGGGGALQRVWMNDSRYFGQGANGIDFATVRSNTGIADFVYDQNVASKLGNANKAVVFAPGSLIYTPYLQYEGVYGNIGTMQRFTMPIPGAEYLQCDVRILPDECNENYAVWMEVYFDVFAAPTTMFATGDNLEGVNGIFNATFTQGS